MTNISTILKRCHQQHNSRDEFGIITSNNSTSHGYNHPDNQIPLKYRYKTQLTSREKEMKVMKKKNKTKKQKVLLPCSRSRATISRCPSLEASIKGVYLNGKYQHE